jgi:hypothetical protein
MPKKVSLSNLLQLDSPAVQLQLKDGCGCLTSRNEVEVELTLRRISDGESIGSIRGLFYVYPFERSPGWYKLVKRIVTGLRKGGQ